MAHRLAPQVVHELDDIWIYLAAESGSIEVADGIIESITDCFLLLSKYPYVGRRRFELRPGSRGFPVGQHVIFYRVDGQDVLILHVVHGHRDIDRAIGQ